MDISRNTPYRYQVGGSLKPNSPTYVERSADQELYEILKNGEFCYIFNSRQMGKSSLRVRTMQRLQKENICCAVLDITLIGCSESTAKEWYNSIVISLWQELKLKDNPLCWIKERQALSLISLLDHFIEEKLLTEVPEKRIVIFIDEIDSILSLPFLVNDFFALIRAIFNQRADKPDYERLTFCLLGVATPTSLINKETKTPFNIGKAISLNGLKFKDAKILAEGLIGFVEKPEKIIKEILDWTGGQPFLTQKLCQIIREQSKSHCFNSVEDTVKSQIVKDWESKDKPPHLITIRERILLNQKQVGKLIDIYQKILTNGEIEIESSSDAIQLCLSGLVVLSNNKLKVHNRIYKEVFNQSWAEDQLKKIRPYSQMIIDWYDSNCQDSTFLLSNKALIEAQEWAADKSLSNQDYKFLNASLSLARDEAKKDAEIILSKAQRKARKRLNISIFTSSLLLIIVSLFNYNQNKELQERWDLSLQRRMSWGEDVFLENDIEKRNAARMFEDGNHLKAHFFYSQSLKNNPYDPETSIYYYNSKFYNKKSIKIAVSVPAGNNRQIAKEMLIGVAQAQREINESKEGINGKRLLIKILDDENDPDIAQSIARDIVKNQEIIAVIGSNASNASRAAANIYQNHLVMITPTSFYINFNEQSKRKDNNYIFRTIPDITTLVNPLIEEMSASDMRTKLIICYDSEADDNRSFAKFFESKIAKSKKIEVVENNCDFSGSYDIEDIVISAINNKDANTLLIAPHIDRISEAIILASIAKRHKPNLQLFSSPSLYTPLTLELGQETVEGMKSVVFWHPDIINTRYPLFWKSEKYSDTLENEFKHSITWRTAMSYDATQAIIHGLKRNKTRHGLQETLSNQNFSVEGITGTISFNNLGDRDIEDNNQSLSYFVKVIKNQKAKNKYIFDATNKGNR